jgi:chromatin remodeling complex protein RSC6
MPKQSKSKTTDLAETATPVVTETVVKVEKAKKPKEPKVASSASTVTSTSSSASPSVASSAAPSVKPTASSSTLSVKTAVSVAPPTVSVAPSSEDHVDDVETSIAAQSVEFMTKLTQLGSMIAALKTEYRTMEKKWVRELKAAQKTSSKKKNKRAGNRAPSGFVKPTRISDELALFLGKDKGSEMARTDVTREINKYIRSHNLQDASNGRKINPDPKLQTLLRLNKTDELTYFNLQRYMSPHFHKAEKPLPVSA